MEKYVKFTQNVGLNIPTLKKIELPKLKKVENE
jgi:hypothetical protein